MERDGESLERFLERADAILSGAEPGEKDMRLGPYRLVRRIGHGAMGVVWLAEDESLQRRVALKILAPHMTIDHEAIWRFGQEASAAARLSHPNIVAVHSAGEEGAIRYIAMDYVQGTGLDQLLARVRGRAPDELTGRELGGGEESYVRRAVALIVQTARALHHAHSRGVLHRDIKPSNILVDREGDIHIVDFGLARIQESAPVTRTGTILGTLTYMAPEALTGRPDAVDARCDVYSLGTVLYELLALRPPFYSASLSDLIDEIKQADVPALRQRHKGLPKDLELVGAKCLAKDREHRYATAEDLARDLERFLEGEPIKARPVGALTRLRYWAKRNPGRAVATVALVLVVLGAWPALRLVAALSAAADARQARADAAGMLDAYKAGEKELEQARASLLELRTNRARFDDDPERSAPIAAAERRLETRILEQARLLEEVRGALERAARLEARFGSVSRETDEAFADYYLFRHDREEALGNEIEAKLFREAALRHDRTERIAARLAGDAKLTVSTKPPGATVHLFVYKDYADVRDRPVVPRLVPVPTDGRTVHAGAWGYGFFPGDTCIVVSDVAAGSPVEPGDLVVTIDGQACGEGAWVRRLVPGGLAERAGVRVWDRVRKVHNRTVRTPEDFWARNWELSDHEVVIGLVRYRVPAGKRPGVEIVGVAELLGGSLPPRSMELRVLRGGKPRTIRLDAGQACATRTELTAYPLILSEKNRIETGTGIELDPGSYLLHVRAKGHEDQRLPILIGRTGEHEPTVKLLPVGTTPEGFVWIPPGPTILEGDPLQHEGLHQDPTLRLVTHAEGFFIRRTEVTLGEWFEFVNDAESLAKTEAARAEGRTIFLPRHYDHGAFAERVDGQWVPARPPECPVYGISRKDIDHFLDWRNRRAEQRGDPWRWAVPSTTLWERAARGADGRLYTWGNRYDSDLCHNQSSRIERSTIHYAARFEPRDESPFGVYDMIGSRREWTTGGLKGGSWGDGSLYFFRASFTDGLGPGYYNWTAGFRPVLEPR